MKELFNTLPQRGTLHWIGASSARNADIRTLASTHLDVGTGIPEDYHAKSGKSKRQVTLIQAEHLPVIAGFLGRESIPPELFRRNLVVAGINLLALRTARFRIGTAELEGTGPCDPCSRMEQNLGPGGWNAMRGHGGITAIVVQSGLIRVGDEVTFLAPLPAEKSRASAKKV